MTRSAIATALLGLGLLLPQSGAAHSVEQVLNNPIAPRAQLAASSRWGHFAVVVSPNLVEYERAGAAALAETARYCQSIGKSAPVQFSYVRRYSTYVLDGWEFGGTCD
jgi:hypothetical protein